MQINDLYIDLEIPSLDKKNFLTPTDTYALEVVETAGVAPPTVYMAFKTFDAEVMNAIQENNKLIVSLGNSEANSVHLSTILIEAKVNQDTSGTGWFIEFGGYLCDSKDFWVNQISYATETEMSSIDYIKDLFKGQSTYISIDKSLDDPMIWRCHNHSAAYFLGETILHMDLGDSFPTFGFDMYGNFHLNSFSEQRSKGPTVVFTPFSPSEEGEVQYINNFNTVSYRSAYNKYSGYDKINLVFGINTGEDFYNIHSNSTLLGASSEPEYIKSGNIKRYADAQSDNVHKTYKKSFIHNTNKLVALSTIEGVLEVPGWYSFSPADLVYVKTNDPVNDAISGYYLIDTVSISVSFDSGLVMTRVTVTRDNKNNIENYIEPSKGLKLTSRMVQALCSAVSNLRYAYAVCKDIFDGEYMKRILSFGIESKNNILRMFSVAGVTVDFTSQANLMKSMLCVSNSLINTLFSYIFPEAIAESLRDYALYYRSFKSVFSRYVAEYVPYELQDLVMILFNSLTGVNDSLNSIARENNITLGDTTVSEPEVETNVTESTADNNLTNIIQDLENNANSYGLDIPFPVITLTESQRLLPIPELRNYVINETIDNLTTLGYLNNVDIDKFKEIITEGRDESTSLEDINTVNLINSNAGNNYGYRFWGTYAPSNDALYAWTYPSQIEKGEPLTLVYTKTSNLSELTRFYNSDYSPYVTGNLKVLKGSDGYNIVDLDTNEKLVKYPEEDVFSNALMQLTEFYIKKGFKDKYKSIPCTKLISAVENARLYFACPKSEKNLKFYINSKRIDLKSFPISLGYVNNLGNEIPYVVYYTESGYNSNSVLFEVRKDV